ncbi:propionate CoA-transferase [Caldalkalibacillus uzonensis]|uniref:Propionate CoA-transferase n=1 Tax=Caldalkalibacillus uzonensis TaxID=353224 RepID=A0ABU0CLS5_9BACI|nr:CoA-transferase [Caldalkalibacillus uzonensis]MDQ0337363.1 propionate CoA-transferase [Caldalkalibacillus uzonensis]
MYDKRLPPEKVVSLIKNNMTLALCGFTLIGACETFLRTLENHYLSHGNPKNLTLIHAAGHSDKVNGIEHLSHKGLVKRIIGSHWGLAPRWGKLIHNNEVEAHCLSQGQLTHLFRAMAAGKPGNISKVGLGTFLDPRIEGGRINDKAKESEALIDILTIDDEEYLFYKEIPIDVCVLRGTTADEFGNVTMEDEALKLEALSIAQATKRYGGTVIVEVKHYAKYGTLHPKQVVIPGVFVDHVIIAKDPINNHRQTSSTFFDPRYSGDLRIPVDVIKPIPLNVRKVIGRRAVKELHPCAVVNLGTGIPGDTIGPVSSEEGILDDIILTVESGTIGGIPMGGTDFGITINADAIIEHAYQFDFYNGRGVDITFMGAAEIDSHGNVNVSKFGTRTVGCGGFIDITQNAKKVVFCSTFTTGGLKVDIQGGKLHILNEGKLRKFVNDVGHITFSGKVGLQNEQEVIYVTERAVFKLTPQGLMLTEVAPGIDIEQDILAHMGFTPVISPDLKKMDYRIFEDGAMGIRGEFLEALNNNKEFGVLFKNEKEEVKQ